MDTVRPAGLRALALMVALAAVLAVTNVPSTASAQEGVPTLEFFGWSHFRLTSTTGKIIHTNPFTTNPDTTVSVDDINKVDLILVADGHPDELGQTVDIVKKTNAMAFAAGGGLNGWLLEQGVPMDRLVQRFANPGAYYVLGDVRVIMLNSIHGNELAPATAANPYGGPAAGYMIRFENGYTIYFSGSSAATADMAIWAEAYKPDAAILHMDGRHDPIDVAMSAKLIGTNNPNLKTIFPHHHRVQTPTGQASLADFQAAMAQVGAPAIQITETVRSQVYQLTK